MQAQIPTVVYQYFARFGVVEHPIIYEHFTPERGWKRQGYNKRVSCAWLVKILREGVERVSLKTGGRVADFSINEILNGQGR